VVFLLSFVGVQEKMGIMNKGVIYALWDYEPQHDDELLMKEGDCMTVIRREDEEEIEWWWARLNDKEGYVPRNLLGVSHSNADVFHI
jgi:apoptosis-stimulating of p53 protein 2